LVIGLALAAVGVSVCAGAIGEVGSTEADLETDRGHFQRIRGAIEAYRKDHDGRWPDWLSDLFPGYLTDRRVLLCPAAERRGEAQLYGNDDPKIPTSYIYEFNSRPASGFHVSERVTMKDWKTKQMDVFGGAVPIVRCLNHEQALNLAVCGEIFTSALFWETDANTLALMERLGVKAQGGTGERAMRLEVIGIDDEKPVQGARVGIVVRGPAGYLPAWEVVADGDGRCELRLADAGVRELRLEVTHKDYVTQVLRWEDEALRLPDAVRVAMERGVAVGGRVADAAGKPIPGVEVKLYAGYRPRAGIEGSSSFQPTIPVAHTDKRGEWRVPGVSPGIVRGYVAYSHPAFRRLQTGLGPAEQAAAPGAGIGALTNQSLVAVLRPRARVNVEAVDAETGRPIEVFEVLLAYPSGAGLAWNPHRRLAGRSGRAVLRIEEEYDPMPVVMRVEADGYQPCLSTRLRQADVDQGLQVKLRRTRSLVGEVVDEGGVAVQGAWVGLLTGLGTMVVGPDGLEAGPGGQVVQSTGEGRVELPELPDSLAVVAWNPTGYAEVGFEAFKRERRIVLGRWGRVRGVLPPGVGGEPAVALVGASEHLPRMFPGVIPGLVQFTPDLCMAQADGSGRFVLERVPAGRRWLWHPVHVGPEYPPIEPYYSFNGYPVRVKPGETTEVLVASRSWRGRVVAPAESAVGWLQALGWVRCEPVDGEGDGAFEVLVTFAHDGQLRLEGLPAGRQRVTLRVFQPPYHIGSARFELEADSADAGETRPVSSVQVQLESTTVCATGQTISGWQEGRWRALGLEPARSGGRPVLVHFWTSWCGAGLASFGGLQDVLARSGGPGNLAVASVNLDEDPALGERFLETVTAPGVHVRGGAWFDSELAIASGLRVLPWFVLLGPDGSVRFAGGSEGAWEEAVTGAVTRRD
jgi:thiol-disulfide isomerase/thioredoxin